MQRTNIYLEEEQLRALKYLAAEERQSVADLVRDAVDDYLAKRMADEGLWRERFETLIERVRSRVPAETPPVEIEADVSAAQNEVRRARPRGHAAAQGALIGRVRPGGIAGSTLKNDPVLAGIVQRLTEAFVPERIYLFGSKARGDAGADSDYDLMVVVSHTTEPGYRLAQRAHTLLWDIGTAADVLVWSREAFDKRLHLKASLPATVVREGKLVYAA